MDHRLKLQRNIFYELLSIKKIMMDQKKIKNKIHGAIGLVCSVIL